MQYKNLIQKLGFLPKENTSDIFYKKYSNCSDYSIEIDNEKEVIYFGGKIKNQGKDFQNITKPEDWVVLECVNRLLEKGYKPENISLEKVYPSGHGHSGRLDICVNRADGSEYLLIECKTYGKEFTNAFTKLKKDGNQLFTYFKFSSKADIIMLYASELKGNEVVYKNEIIKIEDDYRTGDVKDFYDKWNKLTKDNGVFDDWVNPYHFISKALTPKLLEPIKQEDSSFIFNRFLEILRNNVVSDKGNAFNKIFTLFLCKVYDEKSTKETEELKFQWLEGKDDDVSFQLRLTDLYKNGMLEFLEKQVTDFSEEEFENKFNYLNSQVKKDLLLEINKLRLEKNNEFAIKEVFDHQSFKENAKVVKQVVELLQGFRIRYNKRQQYLSDFFELLLTTGLKQEAGQFFTPVPIAQFIIKSLPIVSLVNEKLEKGERNNLLPFIMDYAAGSGHFLTESMHEIQRILDHKKSSDFISDTGKKIKSWQEDHFDWATKYVYGVEKDYRLVKVGKVGCYLHGDGLANVILSDGLASFSNTDSYKGILKNIDKDFPKENKQFDVVLSNPPYSVSAFKLNAREYYTENDFELYKYLTDLSSQIEALFIERTKQLLKDGGIAGIILPSSILSNTGIYAKAREIILQFFNIVAIAELGSNTFMATGTNTVVLFLKRKNNYESINLKTAVDKFFINLQDVTLNGVEKPVTKYVNHVWQTLSFDDYISLLKKTPNKAVSEHEIYVEYRKKIKAKNDKEFWDILLEKEKEKLYYFIIAFPQKVVLVKSGEKDAEKRFLGYEFSNAKGKEGIHPMQRGKNIEDCTQLFDPEVFDNPEKASTYIYKAFNGDFDFPIDENLQKNISRHNLVDMLSFDRVEFEKNVSLSVKKKVMIESKWELVQIGDICKTSSGGTPLSGTSEYYENGNILWINSGEVRQGVIFESENKITELGLQKSSAKIFPKNTVLLAMYGATAGQIGILGVDASTNQAICGILPSPKVLPFYLFNFLKTQYENILALRSGVARLNISQDVVKNIQIPLPPKAIQEKIVAEIEVLEEKEKKAKEEVEGLKNNIISKANELYTKYSLQKLGLLCENPLYGANESAAIGNPEKDYRYIRITDINDNGSLNNDWKTAERVEEKYILKEGDFLFARSGATAGKTFLYKEKHGRALYAGYLIKFTVKQDLLNSSFLNFILKSDNYQDWVLGMRSGTAQPNINAQQYSSFEIPVLPLSEQQKIVSEIEKIEEKINQLEKEIVAIPNQKEAVLRKYLE
ncbi:MAG: restriction endonuclease subunit S [Candidatus Desantisbacteria bacterium]